MSAFLIAQTWKKYFHYEVNARYFELEFSGNMFYCSTCFHAPINIRNIRPEPRKKGLYNTRCCPPWLIFEIPLIALARRNNA